MQPATHPHIRRVMGKRVNEKNGAGYMDGSELCERTKKFIELRGQKMESREKKGGKAV